MLKKYLHITFLYVTIFISITINAYLLYTIDTFYDREYYTEVKFNGSSLGFVTQLQCE
jgi:hypothetical protein